MKIVKGRCRQPRSAGFSSHPRQYGTRVFQILCSSPSQPPAELWIDRAARTCWIDLPQFLQHKVFPRNTQQASRKCFSESLKSVAVMRHGVRTRFWSLHLSAARLRTMRKSRHESVRQRCRFSGRRMLPEIWLDQLMGAGSH